MNSVADIWKIVLSRLSQDLSETTISTWFDEVEAVSIKDRTLYLHCPNDFKRSTIESMFSDRIKDSLRDIYSADFDVKLLSTAESTALFEPEVKKSTALLDSGEFTFDTFVVGESNKMAYAAARAVADGVGHYNPLFIYGDSGLGKTHLIYAIAHQIRTTRPSAKIIYIKGDDFINEFIELVRAGRGSEFRAKYRDADLLLVDDVQFVAGKEQVQNEFFHTFNTLYESHRQIVLTADRPPHEMLRLEDRLKTRFEWGLIADIQPPDYETRMAIIKNKAMSLGLEFPDDVCEYIAENITTNVRQIEGTVKKILAYRDLQGMPLDVASVSRAIKDMYKGKAESLPTPGLIISEVCRFYSIEEQVLRGTLKNKNTAEARQVAMYLCRKLTNLSLPDIGREFGRDHSTVLHGLNKIERLMADSTSGLQDNIRDITANINNKL